MTLLRDGQTSLPPAVAALRCKVADVTRDTCVGGSCCLAKEKEYVHQMVLGPADEIGSEMVRLDGMRDGKMAAAQELWMLQRLNILSQLSEADGEVWKAALGLATATRQLTGIGIAAGLMFSGGSYGCFDEPPVARGSCGACNMSSYSRDPSALGCSNTCTPRHCLIRLRMCAAQS